MGRSGILGQFVLMIHGFASPHSADQEVFFCIGDSWDRCSTAPQGSRCGRSHLGELSPGCRPAGSDTFPADSPLQPPPIRAALSLRSGGAKHVDGVDPNAAAGGTPDAGPWAPDAGP